MQSEGQESDPANFNLDEIVWICSRQGILLCLPDSTHNWLQRILSPPEKGNLIRLCLYFSYWPHFLEVQLIFTSWKVVSGRKRKGFEGAEEFNWTGFGAFRHHFIVLLLSAVISAVGVYDWLSSKLVVLVKTFTPLSAASSKLGYAMTSIKSILHSTNLDVQLNISTRNLTLTSPIFSLHPSQHKSIEFLSYQSGLPRLNIEDLYI